MIDPIEQFSIQKIFTIGHIGNQEIAFTNASAYMFGTVAIISLLMIAGVALFFVDVVVSVRKRLPVGPNPWGAFTLEWTTSSPPPEFNFEELPAIRDRRPALR